MFGSDVLAIDPVATSATIEAAIRHQVLHVLRRHGVVVGLSGGVDSSVVAALCVRALGAQHVIGLCTPERATADESLVLGQLVAQTLGITTEVMPIEPALEALGCYRLQVEAVRLVIPAYDVRWSMKLVLPSLLGGDRLNIFSVVARDPEGSEHRARLSSLAYNRLIAATNMKQRLRKLTEYYVAERHQFAVAGTPNRLEYDQGFFVKNGDGAADFKPIAHLYKTQVYALAAYLGVPEAVRTRPPTTDTYGLPQTQEEFYFGLPYHQMDLCLYAKNHAISPPNVAAILGLTAEQVARVYRDIEAKRRATKYQHLPPLLVDSVQEVNG